MQLMKHWINPAKVISVTDVSVDIKYNWLGTIKSIEHGFLVRTGYNNFWFHYSSAKQANDLRNELIEKVKKTS